MTHSQESRVSSSQDTFRLTEESISSVSALVNRLNSCLALSTDVFDEQERAEKMAASSNQEEKKMENTFPWMLGFADQCRSSVGGKSIKRLEHLLTFYLGNVTLNVKDCYLKPNRAAKLKKCMNEALVFFHTYYLDIREPIEHSSYLDRMTELVSMYVDMEIKASRRRKESLKKVACRLTSSIYIFLDHSEDHILDSILKAKLINKHYRDICNPVLGKVLSQMRSSPLHETLYVRYLLVYKVWKRVVGEADERKRINKVAIQKLTPPPNFTEKVNIFNNVLPKIPKSKKNVTLFYMQAKFNLKNACVAFMKACKDTQQADFSQNLSVNMDKSLFFSERLSDASPRLGNKNEEVDGGGSNKLINDIWFSICNADSDLADNSHLKDMTQDKAKPDQPTGKKKNKEKKNKKKKTKETRDKANITVKGKKKKGKKKSVVGLSDTVSSIGSVTSGDISLLKKACKTKKKKKKKALLALGAEAPCIVSKEESVCMLEAGLESDPVPDCTVPLPEPPASIPVSAAVPACAVVPAPSPMEVRLLEVKVEVSVESEAQARLAASVNDAGTAGSASVIPTCAQVMVNQVNSVGEVPDEFVSVTKGKDKECGDVSRSKERVQPATANQANSVCCIPSRVIVLATAASTSAPVREVLPTSPVVENEALAAAGEEASKRLEPIVTTLPRAERDPVLGPGQLTSTSETVSYACDSSIKNEVPLAEEPTGDNFNSVPMEIDSDVEILAELRPQVAVNCDGEVEVLSDDGEIIRRESHLDNIFATENGDVVYEMLGGGLQVPSMELESSPRCGEEGDEPESPAIETFDMYETLWLTDMMNNFQRSKGDYSHYGGERRDCLYRDSMLHPGVQELSSDDELESCYELNHSHNTYAHSKRPCIRGGKVGYNGAVSSNGYASVGMSEKEVSDSSPSSSCVENENTLERSLNSNCSYLANRSSLYPTTSDNTPLVSSRNTPSHIHVGQKTPAPSTVRTPVVSTPKRISDVNTMRYYTSTLDQVRSESVEDRVASTAIVEKERRATSTPKKTQSCISRDRDSTRSVVPSVIDSTYMNRRVTVHLTHVSPNSAGGSFPDVVLDAHKASGQREKETCKPASRGMLPVANSTRGKFFRPYIDGLYRPFDANSVPPSIPYPAMSAQPSLGQYCTCSQCYANHLLFLSKYNATPGATRYSVPVQYRSTNITTDAEKLKKSAEKLKSEDEELLRRIEESLSDTKLKTEIDLRDSDGESKYKPDLDSSLPLKKRLKTLAHVVESEVKSESKVKPEVVDSTKTESFPSYPTRPMISIAELEINKSLLPKQIPRPIKSPSGNSQTYIQYNNESNYYQTQMQGRDIIKVQNNIVTQYRSYTSDVSSMAGSEASSRELPSFTSAPVVDQQVQRDTYCPKENIVTPNSETSIRVEDSSVITTSTVNHSSASLNSSEYSGRQFKTPAQLKEVPVNDQYYGAPMVIRPALSMTPSQVDASVAAYVTVPREDDSYSQYNKAHVLDLSVDYPSSSKCTKSQRKKKSSAGPDVRTRSSKRSNSRSRSVIQNADTVDDFIKSFEKKRRRKHVSR